MKTKPRLKSKTFVASGSLITLALAILALPELAAWVATLPPIAQAVALLVIGGLGMYLREVTDQPLGGWLRAPKPELPIQSLAKPGKKQAAKK